MTKKNIRYIAFCLLLMHQAFAQPAASNYQLAQQYFNTGEYEKALVYFEKNYDFDPMGTYPDYLKCLEALKAWDKAEKLIKKQIKKTNDAGPLYVDLGGVYAATGDTVKAAEQYDKAIKAIRPDVSQYLQTANKFLDIGNTQKAIETYKQGRLALPGVYPFSFELADAYATQSNLQAMADEYLDIVEIAPQYIPGLQGILQNKIALDYTGSLADVIRQSLLRRIQKSSSRTEYNELLYWLFLQQKDFESAAIQAKALDKRLAERGDRLLTLGRMCVANQDYKTAEICFQYVMDKGRELNNYTTARIELINALNKRITLQSNYTGNDLQKLSADYNQAISELGITTTTAPLIAAYAHLKAFYLNDIDTAMQMLESLIAMPRLSPMFQAECKLDLGDMLILKNEVWDALLYYGQVDKDYKHDEIGREAKFRTARAYYYQGEFEWAAAQLNILKAATTQLISNDAMSLALLIQDNSGFESDSNIAPLLIYAHADLLAFQNHNEAALITLDSIVKEYPGHSLTDEVWFKKAKIFLAKAQIDSAVFYLSDIVTNYPDDILADDALFQMADLQENRLQNKTQAMQLYETLLQKYPGSLFAVDARKRYRTLRGDLLN
ncbi:MAG: tetratricopeptide repeat protein [Bacteroidia bacterium]|nr:tetratricopeptide repeat protein [Bacteroidia bacterium]